MMEEISSKSKYTKLKPKTKMIPTFLVTILTFLTLTTFTAMLPNVDQVEAVTNAASCNALDPNPNAECDVTVDYDGDCSPSNADCNVNINVNANPSANNQLRLNYLLETGIECSSVQSSWGQARCLAASQNEYRSNVGVTTGTGATSDNQFNFEGSQQVRETAGQNNFFATNDMTQNVNVNTQGTGSVVDTNGEGDNFQLEHLQDIVEPDDTRNTNNAHQLVTLEALNGGKIDTSEHSELGFRVEQRLLDIDDTDLASSSNPPITVTATNRANQVLGIDSTNGAEINYDTNGLSLVSQTIDDCSFGTADCLNSAGTPGDTSLTNGQRVQIFADGAGDVAIVGNDEIEGTNVDVDNLRQLLNQNIDNFENANDREATNRADNQLFHAVAANGGDIDMAGSGFTEQTQSIRQSIRNSDENTVNAANQQLIRVGTDLIPIEGLVKADVDQRLQQSISRANIGPSINSGIMVMTLLAKTGPSELFVEGFDQYITQTTSCSNCQNNAQIHALFEVSGDATFTLQPGSIQGLTQTATVDGTINENTVTSQITVLGDGTIANIYLDHQIYNINDQNSGISSFQATYNDGNTYNRNCVITQPGTYTDINGVFTGSTPSGGQCTSVM